MCLKKPTSSRKIDSIVIEINRHNIFKGLIASLEVKPLATFESDTLDVINISDAPIKETIQYVPIPNFPILILGKNNIDKISVTQVTPAIIIDSTIKFTEQDRIIALSK